MSNESIDMTKKVGRPKKNSAAATTGKAMKPQKQHAVDLIFMNGLPLKDGKSVKEEYIDFLKTLPKKSQTLLLKMERSLMTRSVTTPVKYRLLMSKMDDDSKRFALQRMQSFQELMPEDIEYAKQREWFETLMQVPFGELCDLPVSHESSPDDIQKFLYETQQNLNKHVWGLTHAKSVILQLVARWITHPRSVSHAIGLQGPKGVGKTNLVFHGLAKTFNRPFHLISLGGSKDSNYLNGYEFTYQGSRCEHLVDILISSRYMNPIIFSDELDKVSDSSAGQEVIGNLIHLIDTSQNTCIRDRYFGGIKFDFSNALFVFSYNDITKVDPILLDRILNIKLEGYKCRDKMHIARSYFIPEIAKNIGMDATHVDINDDCIKYIIEKYTDEEGVRTLRKSLDTIYLKINTLILTQGPAYKMDLDYHVKDLRLPVNVDCKVIDDMLSHEFGNQAAASWPSGMYV